MPNLQLPLIAIGSNYPKDPAPSLGSKTPPLVETCASGALASATSSIAKGSKDKDTYPRNNYKRTILISSLAAWAQQAVAMPANGTSNELCSTLSPAPGARFTLPPATMTEASWLATMTTNVTNELASESAASATSMPMKSSNDFQRFLRIRTTADARTRLGDASAAESGLLGMQDERKAKTDATEGSEKPIRKETETSIRISLGTDPVANREHLLQIPSFALRFVGGHAGWESHFLSVIRNRYAELSASHVRDVAYVKELKKMHEEIGEAKIGYAPFGGADTLTLQAIAPHASVYILTNGGSFYIDIARFREVFSPFFLPLVSGATLHGEQYVNYDSPGERAGEDRYLLGFAMLRILVGHFVYGNAAHHDRFPEFYVTTADLSENGDVTFGPLSVDDSKPNGGLAIWLKDGDQTKVFIWKQIFIEERENSQSTKNAITGVRNLLAKVSEDKGTAMLAKAIDSDLLTSEPNERYDLVQKLLTPPEEQMKAVVCDRNTEAKHKSKDAMISPPIFVQELDDVVEWKVPGGFGHGDDGAFIYRRSSGPGAGSV